MYYSKEVLIDFQTILKTTGSLIYIIGSIVLACTLVAISYNSSAVPEIESIWLAMLDGVAVAFCGSLTTVSTFVSQICSLSFRMSVFYVIISLVLSQVMQCCVPFISSSDISCYYGII